MQGDLKESCECRNNMHTKTTCVMYSRIRDVPLIEAETGDVTFSRYLCNVLAPAAQKPMNNIHMKSCINETCAKRNA